jgi:D-alanyl-D-alanine dipeptidase
MKIYLAILTILLAYATWVFVVAMQNFEYSSSNAKAFESMEIALQPDQFNLKYTPKEQYLLSIGMVDLATIDSTLIIDLAYCSTNNFTGKKLYTDINRAFLQSIIAERLKTAQAFLHTIDSTYNIVVFDATRPKSVQTEMWNWAIENNLQQYVGDPLIGSVHQYGCAVDVSIMGKDSLLDMGTNFDHFGPEAEPRNHWKLLQEGKLTQEQLDNRMLLRSVMRKAGFMPIENEWWHFNGLSKKLAQAYFPMVE